MAMTQAHDHRIAKSSDVPARQAERGLGLTLAARSNPGPMMNQVDRHSGRDSDLSATVTVTVPRTGASGTGVAYTQVQWQSKG